MNLRDVNVSASVSASECVRLHECESASDWGDDCRLGLDDCDRPLSPVSNKKRTRMRRRRRRRTADAPSEEPEPGTIVSETERRRGGKGSGAGYTT